MRRRASMATAISAKGCIVIDTSRAFRMDPQTPLVMPEVNAAAIDGYTKRNIVAVPDGVDGAAGAGAEAAA
jgi:aspartate-semialdehyde dehydrogenase